MMIESVSKAILDVVTNAGYSVTIKAEELTAQNTTTGTRFVIPITDSDYYAAAIRLAEKAGIDLEDG